MKIGDIEKMGDGNLKITLPKTKNKKRREFVIDGGDEPGINLLEKMRKYLDIRPANVPSGRFFLRYTNGKCIRQPIGIHTMGDYPRKIASFLNLPNATLYTGHCFRRSSISMLADTGVDISVVQRHAGLGSAKVAEGYVERSEGNKCRIAAKILGSKHSSYGEGSSSGNSVDVKSESGEGSSNVVEVNVDDESSSSSDAQNITISSQSNEHVVQTTNNFQFPPSLFNIQKMDNVTINVYQK